MRSFRSLAVFGLLALTGIACNAPTTKDTKSAGVGTRTEAIKEAPKKPAEPSMLASAASECLTPPVVKIGLTHNLDQALLTTSTSFGDLIETEGLGSIEKDLCVDLVFTVSNDEDNRKAFEAGTFDGTIISFTDLFTVAAGRKKQIDDATVAALADSWDGTVTTKALDPSKQKDIRRLNILVMGDNLMDQPRGQLAVKAIAKTMAKMVARLDPKDPEMRTKTLTSLASQHNDTPMGTDVLEKVLLKLEFISTETSFFNTTEFEQIALDLEAFAVTNKVLTKGESYTIGLKMQPVEGKITLVRFDDSAVTIPTIKMDTMEIKAVDPPTALPPVPTSANADPVLTNAPPSNGTAQVPMPTSALPTPASQTP